MSTTPVAINVKLNARLQPEHRLQLFEDPLEAMLEAAGIGEIMGGGHRDDRRGRGGIRRPGNPAA